MWGIIAAVVIALVTGATIYYYNVYKPRRKTQGGAQTPSGEANSGGTPPPPPTSPGRQVNLTPEQCRELFDEILPVYWMTHAGQGDVVVQITIDGIGRWVADQRLKTLKEPVNHDGDTPDVILTVKDLDTFNDILSQDGFTMAYALGLLLRKRISISGDRTKLEVFSDFLNAIQADQETILSRLQ